MVMETGMPLREAMALYAACGYVPTANFGSCRDCSDSRCFAEPP
ncbi:hypothetical protein [Streptomyces regalis]